MKKNLFALTLLSAIMINYGCMTEKRIEKFKRIHCHGEVTHSDSTTSVTTNEVTPHDTTLYQTVNALTNALFECDSMGNVKLKEVRDSIKDKNTTITVTPSGNNHFAVNCKVDSAAVYLRYFNTHKTTRIEHKVKDKEVVRVEVEKPFSWWTKTCRIGFPILASFIILYILFRIFRKKLTFTVNPFV